MLKPGPVTAVGTMSGTSLDGVDAAVIETDGRAILGFGAHGYRAYTADEQAVLRAALGAWPGDPGVDAATEVIEAAHLAVLRDLPGDIVGFHGQTLAHDPAGRGTHQAGDGARLARALGRTVVWDFRSNDVRLGGQGAPLAPFFHFAAAQWAGLDAPCAFLNLGGVGNLTWLDPRAAGPEATGAILAFDTGPANAPLNDLMLARRGLPHDAGGALAATGRVVDGALELFLDEGYFLKIPPKSLDRNDFSVMLNLVRELPDADAAATMTAMAAAAVLQGMQYCPSPPAAVYACGGGRHNPVMMAMIAAALDCPVLPVETIGLNGDMLEAQAFAYLAVRVAMGLPTSCPATTGVRALVGGGIVSRP
jgi:anhydro-N-acetylmuramic acid kinase